MKPSQSTTEPAGADGVGTLPERSLDVGAVDPCGSRQLGRRSAVCIHEDTVVAGLADGSLLAVDARTGRDRWRWAAPDGAGSVVSLAAFRDGVLAGERGADGAVRLHDAATGAVEWRYRTAGDVGEPQRDTRFFLPFVVDATVADGRAFVAARRYGRGPDGGREFDSVVYAFRPSGGVAWRYRADASPIALDADGDRVAVGYNRCPGDHREGLVALEAATGAQRYRWDPPGDGDRRVGDVSLTGGGVALASHADYRGYRLDGDGVAWRVDLGRPVDRGGETVYAYPNHVHATPAGALFLTGNTYPREGRETDRRHPAEHTAVGVGTEGCRRWEHRVGGFVHGTAHDGDRVVVPVAQHFRERDPAVHAVRAFHLADGHRGSRSVPGVATAAAVRGDRVVAVEEPVAYHDDGTVLGAYRLLY